MKLTAYLEAGVDLTKVPEIRPAKLERDWMEQSPQRFAYRCLPLNIANTHGWEVLCPVRTRVRWAGGPAPQHMGVLADEPHFLTPVSHFGSGVLTFPMPFIIQTEPGYELWVGGPPNTIKHGVTALSGVVETDWSPYPFTMNWRFTAPGEVVFEKGEPICFFFPLQRSALQDAEPEFQLMADAGEIKREFDITVASRTQHNKDLQVEGSKAREEGWQRTYFQGRYPSGKLAPDDHRTKSGVRPFKPLAPRKA
jgi:hypothetical protein